MEQVLSSPRGRSDWESDQNSLGFLLLDNDNIAADGGGREKPKRRQRGEPGIVSLSFDEIFQDSSLNLDELFRASRYSGLEQAYPWERSSDCVSPSWDKQQSLAQKNAEKDCYETPHDGVTADLISFNSSAPSPTHTCTSMQAGDVLQCIHMSNTDCPLDGLIDQLPLDPVLEQTLSQTLPTQRTSVAGESPDAHWTNDLTSSQTTPEKAMDFLCADLLGLAEESSRSPASCNFETSLESLISAPLVSDLSSSHPCSVSHPDASDELSPLLLLEFPVQSCDGNHAVLQTSNTTTAGLSSGEEHDMSLISNVICVDAAESRSRPQSPAGPLVSSKTERTLGGSDSEAKTVTLPKSTVSDGSPESSPLCLSDEHPCEEEMDVEMESDISPNEPAVQELESDFAHTVPLLSPTSVPERKVPEEPMSTSLVPETGGDFLPEYSNDKHCVNTEGGKFKSASESPCDSLSDDIHSPKPLASEKKIVVDTFPAVEKEPPPISPSICPSLEANAETYSSSEAGSKHNPSESANSPENTGKEQTINMPDVDIQDQVTHKLAAVETHLLLHLQEVVFDHTSLNGAAQHCQDHNICTAEISQQPDSQDESECLCVDGHKHVPSHAFQDPHTVTVSADSSVNTHTPDSTPVSEEMLPASDSSMGGEIEGRHGELGNVTHEIERAPAPIDSTLLSGAASPLSQVGMAIKQERGGVTSRLSQSAGVRVDRETDLPDQLTQADLSQVAEPKLNPLRKEPSREETCPPLMEDNAVLPDDPSNEEMALQLCVSSDMIQDGSLGASSLPAACPQDDEHSALRAVFQALDQDGDGFVRIEEFMDFATAYGVEQVNSHLL